jgi:hypothetical protein
MMADQVITFDATLGFTMTTNDVLVINTEDWTVLKNGVSYVGKIAAGSELFWLKNGDNEIEFASSGTVDITIIQKDRWL